MRLKTLIFTVAALVLTSTSAMAFFGLFDSHQAVEAEDGVVSIPISEVTDGKAHFYRFEQGGAEVRFFVMQSRDGVIRAAFDACDVCFQEKKGYSQQGEYMVCNNCGQRFHSSRINVIKGGCNPSPLARTYDQRTLTIKAADIMAGRGLF